MRYWVALGVTALDPEAYTMLKYLLRYNFMKLKAKIKIILRVIVFPVKFYQLSGKKNSFADSGSSERFGIIRFGIKRP